MAESRFTPVAVAPSSSPAHVQVPATLFDAGGEGADPLKALLGTLRRNALLIALVAAVTVGTAAYKLAQQLPVYRATALIRLVDTRQSMTGNLGGIIPTTPGGGQRADPVLSQLEVLKGRLVMGQVVDRVGLRVLVEPATAAAEIHELVEVRAPDAAAKQLRMRFEAAGYTADLGGTAVRGEYGQPLERAGVRLNVHSRPSVPEVVLNLIPREKAIDYLIAGLEARPKAGTDAVEIVYAANDPQFARGVVNTALQEFQEFSTGTEQQQASRRRVFLENRLRSADSLFNETQFALTAFRSRERVYGSSEQFAGQQEALTGLKVRREELAADRGIYRSLLADLARRDGRRDQALRTLLASGLAADPAVAQLSAQLRQYQSALDSLTTGATGVTAAHPDVERLNGQIVATEGRLIDAVRSHVAALDARIAALDAMQTRDATALERLPATEAQEVRLVQRVDGIRKLTDQLREELQRAQITEAVEAGQVQVVYPAPLPSDPVGASRSVKLGIALVFGLLLGGGGAVLRDRMNTVINGRSELERLLQVPGLATIPPIHVAQGRFRALRRLQRSPSANRNGAAKHAVELVTVTRAQSLVAEAYRTLRTNLIFSRPTQMLQRVVVTSSAPGEGKTTTAANLAAAFAQHGLRVLLVDCDLRKGRLHAMFGVPREPGLTHLVLGYSTPEQAIRATPVEGLFVLTSGTLPPNPSELLGSPQMRETLARLDGQFDVVILDTPPLTAAADAAILGTGADGVLFVVRAGQTERGAARQSIQQLVKLGARVLGAVINDPDDVVARYEENYSTEYYGSEA